jgi:mycothiol system anti-sigma-R factor
MSTDNSNCGDGHCAEALKDLELFLDGELPAAELTRIQGHLADCYPCADRATFEEQLRALVRDKCAEHAPPELVDQIRQRLQAM